ncbi:MAG: hypothetical protein OCU18_05575 [Candidatus Syntrophoarchaeum sp.]|nr:hypothetical protein [Candidatus Syntrophoarchaeum sp.]
MIEEETSSISLVEKIFNKMFESIEGSDEFDDGSIQKLKELNTREELHKANKVKKAIIPNRGVGNETN